MAAGLGLVLVAARPAHADFSACESAHAATEPHQQVRLYTTCITRGGIPRETVSWAFNARAAAHLALGEDEQALKDFSSSVDYDPTFFAPYLNRAGILIRRGKWPEAQADLDKALSMAPRTLLPEAWLLRAELRLHQKDLAGAQEDLERALQRGAGRADIYNSAAWLLAAAPDPAFRNGPRAVELAGKAVRKDDRAAYDDTLAAAFAAAGRFDEAVAEESKALARFRPGEGDAQDYQKRLDLYRARTALHQPP